MVRATLVLCALRCPIRMCVRNRRNAALFQEKTGHQETPIHLLASIQVTARSICRPAEDSLAYTALCIPHFGQVLPLADAPGARPLIRSSITPDSAHACAFLIHGKIQIYMPCARAPLTKRRRP